MHYRAMIFYDFKVMLDQEKCHQRLQLAYGNEDSIAWYCIYVINEIS